MAGEPPLGAGRVVARLARQLELALVTVELTPSQYRVLGILDDGREAASVLADKLAVSRPSITGVVDGLVLRGLVARYPGGSDRRRIGLDLTATGRELLARADAEVERRLTEIVVGLDLVDARRAFEALGTWCAALDAYRARKHGPPVEAADGAPVEAAR